MGTFFLQYKNAIFNPASGGKTDQLGNLPPHNSVESHSNVNHRPLFCLKVSLHCSELELVVSHVSYLILDNNGAAYASI